VLFFGGLFPAASRADRNPLTTVSCDWSQHLFSRRHGGLSRIERALQLWKPWAGCVCHTHFDRQGRWVTVNIVVRRCTMLNQCDSGW
jgi:hypothetical protein